MVGGQAVVGSAWYQPASVPKLHRHKVRGPSSSSFRLESKTRVKETREKRQCRERRQRPCCVHYLEDNF